MLLHAVDITKRYGREDVLRAAGLQLQSGEMLSILGRSGSGKTTLLKILAGLEAPDSGQVFLEGRDISGLPPNLRGIVYLYQEPLLFPHLNVFENIAFGLRLRHLPRQDVNARVTQLLDNLELPGHAGKMPHQLSGGQRQRVAFGRALAVQPKVLLLDEPFGALDAETRASMQVLLQQITRQYGITGIFVTHGIKEAIVVGSRIALMRDGGLKAYETIQAFIDDPTTGVRDEMDFWKGLS